LSETKIKLEKGVLLTVATSLISSGISLVTNNRVVEGAICIIAGVSLFFLREHLKFHRWHSATYWHGEKVVPK